MHDKNGVPIHEGDLLRTPHYIGSRRKQHYLYHVVVDEAGVLYAVPTAHLVPSLVSGGGKAPLSLLAREWGWTEVISGYGPGDYLDYGERPKLRARKGEK